MNRIAVRSICLSCLAVAAVAGAAEPTAFEGRINTVMTRGPETNGLLYMVAAEQLRIEATGTSWPHPIDLVDLKSGALTLVFPHNRSFVRLKPASDNGSGPAGGALGETRPTTTPQIPALPGVGPQFPAVPGPGIPAMTAMPPMPPGVGPQSSSLPSSQPSAPVMPPMPVPPMMGEKLELKATGQTTNLLGFACVRYELKQRGETLEIWATDKLLPYQPYVRNQPSRFGPRMLEEQWGSLLKAKKLFPLLAVLRFEAPTAPSGAAPVPPGPERFRFEVTAVKEEGITDGKLFQVPVDYQEIEPLPF
jgi:hypothetical protein